MSEDFDYSKIFSKFKIPVNRIKECIEQESKTEFPSADSKIRAMYTFQGKVGLQFMLKEKWTSIGVVSALLLTITAPFTVNLPSNLNFSEDKIAGQIFQVLMSVSALASLLCILQSVKMVEYFNLWVPSESDMYWFDSLGYSNDPFVSLWI
jgi:hypothetical protein